MVLLTAMANMTISIMPISLSQTKRALQICISRQDFRGAVPESCILEKMAHNFLLRSRKFDNRHDWKAVDAAPVESWIQREATVLLGERIKAKSWVVGVKVFADHIWEKVLSKEYQSFSIGGRGVRVPRVRFG